MKLHFVLLCKLRVYSATREAQLDRGVDSDKPHLIYVVLDGSIT